MDSIISHVIAGLLGALVGAAVAYLLLGRTRPGRSAAKARAELDQYREAVADHFARTAGLVDQLTDSYKDVFDQLQKGATELLDPQTLREKLADQSGEVITLNRLGYRRPQDEEGPPQDAVADEDPDEHPEERPPQDAVADEHTEQPAAKD